MTEPIHDLLDQTATRRPDHPALITLDGSWTYAELALATRQAAAWLRTQGVGRGDRVAIMLPSGPDTVLACYAASRLGAIFVVVSPQIKSFQLGKVLGNAEPALLVTDRSSGQAGDHSWPTVTRAQFRAGMRRTAPVPAGWPGISTDPACLIYTSGSTADPKGVVSPHRTMRFAAAAIGGRLGLRAADVIGCFLPLSFDYGLYQIFLAAQAGATLVLGDPSEVGPGLLPRLRDSRVTVLPLVPSCYCYHFRRWIDGGDRLRSR